jgi:hypothetical protein
VRQEELRAWLDDDPTAVTPAAGLRPVLQDAVLPSAVFVAGPGELRYLAQLRGVYEQHGVPMPLVWPRASATVLQPPVRRILERHGLDWRVVQRDPRHARTASSRCGCTAMPMPSPSPWRRSRAGPRRLLAESAPSTRRWSAACARGGGTWSARW